MPAECLHKYGVWNMTMAQDFIYDFRLQHPCRSSRASPYSSSIQRSASLAGSHAMSRSQQSDRPLDNPRRVFEIIAEELHIACASDHPGPDTHGR